MVVFVWIIFVCDGLFVCGGLFRVLVVFVSLGCGICLLVFEVVCLGCGSVCEFVVFICETVVFSVCEFVCGGVCV